MLLADLSPPRPVLIVLLELPVVMALIDCSNRPEDHFAEGASDRKAWIRWLSSPASRS